MNKNIIEMVIFKTNPKITKEYFLQMFHSLSNALEKIFQLLLSVLSLCKAKIYEKEVALNSYNFLKQSISIKFCDQGNGYFIRDNKTIFQ